LRWRAARRRSGEALGVSRRGGDAKRGSRSRSIDDRPGLRFTMRAQRIPLRRDGEVRVPLLGGPSRAAAAAVVQGEARRCCSIGAWAFRTVVALALVAASAFMQAHGLIPHEQVDARRHRHLCGARAVG